MSDSVVVTGIGVALPGTNDTTDLWSHLAAGRSQVGWLDRFDAQAHGLPVHAAAQIRDFDEATRLADVDERHRRKYSREITIAMAAIGDALGDAGLTGQPLGERMGIVQSCSRGPLEWWRSAIGAEAGHFDDSGAMFRGLAGCPASLSAIRLGARGLVTTISSACVGGHHAIGLAMQEILSGRADVMLAGGHEFPVLAEVARCYSALGSGVLSTESQDPARAVRSYSADREGFALGEGATTLCLERESDARRRGARIYARLLAHVPANEANHGTSMDMTGKVTSDVMRRTLEIAGHAPDDVDLVCGHGTATRYNDLAESRALRELYPTRSADQLPPHVSNKPIYGHTFGMAGVINVAATSLMLHHQTLAPTANLRDPDPECDSDHVAEGARSADLDVALSMTFAFGSQTSMMALQRAA